MGGWRRADASFSGSSFDVVFSSDLSLFSMVDNLDQTREWGNAIVRSVRPGGLFLLVWTSDLSGDRSITTWMSWSEKQLYDYLSSLHKVKSVNIRCVSGRLVSFFGSAALSRFATKIGTHAARLLRRRIKVIAAVRVLGRVE